ncbi:unnamed protein product, partial [Ectocarpus fasciculatus]
SHYFHTTCLSDKTHPPATEQGLVAKLRKKCTAHRQAQCLTPPSRRSAAAALKEPRVTDEHVVLHERTGGHLQQQRKGSQERHSRKEGLCRQEEGGQGGRRELGEAHRRLRAHVL